MCIITHSTFSVNSFFYILIRRREIAKYLFLQKIEKQLSDFSEILSVVAVDARIHCFKRVSRRA